MSFLMLLSFFSTVRPMNQHCKKCGFFKVNDYRLSHDSRVDIDRDVSTAHCSSSSGDSVDLLSRTICTTVVVNDWCVKKGNHVDTLIIKDSEGCLTTNLYRKPTHTDQ